MKKYSLTKNTREWRGRTLFQIKAEISFGNVKKGELGGYIEKEENLSQEGNAWVYGNTWVCGNARVYGDACVYAKASFTKGKFIGGSDSDKITNITEQTGSTFWKNQYVLGDYEIMPIEEKKEESLIGQEVSVTIGDKTYKAVIKD
jgi:hypothetical protein